jgi:uncharacterized protein YbjT (DUF2867 family)
MSTPADPPRQNRRLGYARDATNLLAPTSTTHTGQQVRASNQLDQLFQKPGIVAPEGGRHAHRRNRGPELQHPGRTAPAARGLPVTVVPAASDDDAPELGRIVTVFGGTGFLGHHVVRSLLNHGFQVRVAARHPERISSLLASEAAGPETIEVDIFDEASVASALVGAYGVVNALSLYLERGGRETFRAVHVDGAARIARLAREAGVERFVHVSGIGADPASSSKYIRARGSGEIVVQETFPGATLVRPSVMFGPDDHFLTTLASLLKTLPVYPVFGRGETRLQPVHVEDVAEAIARILGGEVGAGHPCYEFGGPRSYSYAELLRTIASQTGTRARLLPLPFALWRAVARLCEFMPAAPLTRGQVALMQRDNVASQDLPGLADLQVAPTALDDVVPTAAAAGSTSRR